MEKTPLMIHEFREIFLQLPLKKYTLTFDDGLFSQYQMYQKIKHIPTTKIFFVSSSIICGGKQSFEFPTCQEAHKKAFQGNYEDYMTLEQIKELQKDPLVVVGAHSHSHTRLTSFSSLAEKVKHIEKDTKQLIEWFKQNLGISPNHFCFPYNDDMQGLYKALLIKYGFTKFFGGERIPIETLLQNETQLAVPDIALN